MPNTTPKETAEQRERRLMPDWLWKRRADRPVDAERRHGHLTRAQVRRSTAVGRKRVRRRAKAVWAKARVVPATGPTDRVLALHLRDEACRKWQRRRRLSSSQPR